MFPHTEILLFRRPARSYIVCERLCIDADNITPVKNYDLGVAEDVLKTLFWPDTKNGIDLFPLQPEYTRI